MSGDGTVRPSAGVLEAFDLPAGPGVRVDTCGHSGFRTNPRFDSLLAKVIVHVAPGASPDEFQAPLYGASVRRSNGHARIVRRRGGSCYSPQRYTRGTACDAAPSPQPNRDAGASQPISPRLR